MAESHLRKPVEAYLFSVMRPAESVQAYSQVCTVFGVTQQDQGGAKPWSTIIT